LKKTGSSKQLDRKCTLPGVCNVGFVIGCSFWFIGNRVGPQCTVPPHISWARCCKYRRYMSDHSFAQDVDGQQEIARSATKKPRTANADDGLVAARALTSWLGGEAQRRSMAKSGRPASLLILDCLTDSATRDAPTAPTHPLLRMTSGLRDRTATTAKPRCRTQVWSRPRAILGAADTRLVKV
jgi:hypothetical protein